MKEKRTFDVQLIKFKKNLGKALRGDRELYEVPLDVIAKTIDMSESTVSQIEKGTYTGSVDNLFLLIILYDRYFKQKMGRRYKVPFHKNADEDVILKATLNRVYQVLSA